MRSDVAQLDDAGGLTALAVALLCVNLAADGSVFVGATPALATLVCQGGTAAIAAAAAAYAQSDRARGLAAHLALWLLFGGVLGVFVWLAMTLCARAATPDSYSVGSIDDEIDADPLESLAATASSILDQRRRIEGASTVPALHDVVARGAAGMQLRALAALAARYDARLAPTLALALRSQDASVRVLAATALAKLHQQYGAQVEACGSSGRRTPEQSIARGEALLRFAQSGLLNAERRAGAIDQAEAAFTEALRAAPASRAARDGGAACARARAIRLRAILAPRPCLPSAVAVLRSLS